MSLLRRPLLAVLVAVSTAGLAACGTSSGPTDDADDVTHWTSSQHPVSLTGLVWADAGADGVVHLGDGTSLDTEARIGGYVIAGDGAYVVRARTPAEVRSDDDHHTITDPALLVVTPDGVTSTGAHADPSSLVVSPDGRYLGFVDRTTGTRDRFGRALDQAVVVDLQHGREVLRTDRDMGDPRHDDLTDLYEDAEDPTVTLTDDAAYVDAVGSASRFDLVTHETTPVDSVPPDPTDPEVTGRVANPSGTWSFRNPNGSAHPHTLTPATGAPITVDLPGDRAGFLLWTDDATAVAAAVLSTYHLPDPDGDAGADATGTYTDRIELLTCTVPSGACAVLPGTGDGVVLPVDRTPYFVR